MELWSKPTAEQPARLVAVVGDYDPGAVQLGPIGFGSMLAFKPAQPDSPATLSATWSVGGDPASVDLDEDGDGLPDGWEIRYGLDRRDAGDAALDSDGDGLRTCSADCDDTNGDVWATPGEVPSLDLSDDTQTLSWIPPASLGGTAARYDLLRSDTAGDFMTAATCVVSDTGPATTAQDSSVPAAGATKRGAAGSSRGVVSSPVEVTRVP